MYVCTLIINFASSCILGSCWDVSTGKVNSTVNGADVRWRTRHCKLVRNLLIYIILNLDFPYLGRTILIYVVL